MKKDVLPLENLTINELFNGPDRATFEIPVYQRNYAWEKDEITALINDVYDSYTAYTKNKEKPYYYIGTLVTFDRGDRVFEVIDGQQRLTTISLILSALKAERGNRLTYKARKKSDDTLKNIDIPDFDVEEKDVGIVNGYKCVVAALDERIKDKDGGYDEGFTKYFIDNVRIIHYRVPKDIDLNRYFEIMNSRGEQLEKQEIVKAKLMNLLESDESALKAFSAIWNSCSEMGVYVQQTFPQDKREYVFGSDLTDFVPKSFSEISYRFKDGKATDNKISIKDIIDNGVAVTDDDNKNGRADSFRPVIDFPNFLLTVLKITRMGEEGFDPLDFILDDKELINEFEKKTQNENKEFAEKFAYNLLKAKYFLDNYTVHHSNEDDRPGNNPWALEIMERKKNKDDPRNLFPAKNDEEKEKNKQEKAVQLLSMFEVSFTARQRKNYLFYCLLYLFNNDFNDTDAYLKFLEDLADKYFCDVYLDDGKLPDGDADDRKLNAINVPKPRVFDMALIKNNELCLVSSARSKEDFNRIYGNGEEKSKGVPLFIFNYIDFKLWKKYSEDLKGKKLEKDDDERKKFFASLGCSDFGLEIFRDFYFSRTRRSLEHFYPQSWVRKMEEGPIKNGLEARINSVGNYGMIGAETNSAGSDWSPKDKSSRYKDASGKINPVSVASLKFWIMMQKCSDNTKSETRENGKEWDDKDMEDHQKHILEILFP